mmetsp:Transcript_44815/g.72987  ORF Transcript_44815/g.72987 Transcript_44815/m.72987 type:complete len:151 (-) Transcript_44815:65-517(-)
MAAVLRSPLLWVAGFAGLLLLFLGWSLRQDSSIDLAMVKLAVNLNDLAWEHVSHQPEITKRVMIKKGSVPHLTNFSQAKFKPRQRVEEHLHPDMFEVFFIESGEGLITVEGVEISVRPGSCIRVGAGEKHSVVNTSDSEDLVMTYFGILP